MTREEAARRLGMAVEEVVAVDKVKVGDVVTTHDGHRTLIDTDDVLFWYGEKAPNAGLPLYNPTTAEVELPKPAPKKG